MGTVGVGFRTCYFEVSVMELRTMENIENAYKTINKDEVDEDFHKMLIYESVLEKLMICNSPYQWIIDDGSDRFIRESDVIAGFWEEMDGEVNIIYW